MSLSHNTYSQTAVTGGDAETGWGDTHADSATGGPYFQDVKVSPATLADGTLRQRFDTKAYPQLGHTYTGTDADGANVPADAKTVSG